MAKNLVIVESPAKARTLGKYLGRNYQVKASIGHVMDLPKSKLGVDIERDFAPEYHVIQGKAKVLEEIKKAAKDKENVYLAPDPDREGEAIAWHIAQKLGVRRKNVHRVLFNEITKKAVLAALAGADWTVTKVERKERRRHPTPPFITSRLQQEASRKLGFQPSRTMRVAQRLYEGIELGPEGSVGLITYMRTDSTRIAGEALAAARDYIQGRYGAPYLPESPQVYRSKKDAQDAHEAIRPTAMDDEQRDPEEEGEGQLPPLAEGDRLRLLELVPEQHFTQPPPRFTQATLVKELEEKGIGRPSTYASIVGTILNKEYVLEDDQRRLKPTELGFLVTDLLVEAFPDVLNVEFTAGMEDQLDRIEEGEEHYVDALRRFWGPFAKDLEQAEVQMRDVKREERPTDLVCERCGQPMVIKWGRRGEFLACRGYPECKNTKNFRRADDGSIRPVEPETTGELCEQCGRPMQVRFGRYGKFLGCSGYPECRNMQPLHKPVPTGVRCLLGCGEGELMERRSRRGKLFYSCSRYPACQFVAWDRPVPEPCPRCGTGFVTEKLTKRYGTE